MAMGKWHDMFHGVKSQIPYSRRNFDDEIGTQGLSCFFVFVFVLVDSVELHFWKSFHVLACSLHRHKKTRSSFPGGTFKELWEWDMLMGRTSGSDLGETD